MGKFYDFCRKSNLFLQENLMIFVKKFYSFLEENLMLFAEKYDDFCKKILRIRFLPDKPVLTIHQLLAT